VQTTLQGVFPALVTPLTADDRVDHDTLAGFIDYLIDECGVHGVIPLGSTGEFYALSRVEREAVLHTTLDAAAGRVPVVAGTNAGSTADVVRYAGQAEQMGAAAVLLAAPYYSLPTQEELYEHFRAVDAAISIPIMLYNYPGRTGVDMLPDLVERLAELENVQCIKESTGDVTRVSEIIRRCGEKIAVFCGCDTLALESFLLGAVGWVGGVVNVLPREHVELYRLAVVERDFAAAREHYYRLLPALSLMEGGGKYAQFVKAGCALSGHPVGPPRAPLRPATGAEEEQIRAALAALS
jgi:4-hydroxy-tetrahydrodipicolinate synthase